MRSPLIIYIKEFFIRCKITLGKSTRITSLVEPTEEQYLILNALETLELLQFRLYDESTGDWIIITQEPSLACSVSEARW